MVRRKWLIKKLKLSTKNSWMKNKSNSRHKIAPVQNWTQPVQKVVPQLKSNKSQDLIFTKVTKDQMTLRTSMISLRPVPNPSVRNVWPEKSGMSTKIKNARRVFHSKCAFSPVLQIRTLESVSTLAPTMLIQNSTSCSIKSSLTTTNMLPVLLMYQICLPTVLRTQILLHNKKLWSTQLESESEETSQISHLAQASASNKDSISWTKSFKHATPSMVTLKVNSIL